ncbi:conserved hypothetical protein [Hyella patelloides LEGE 07179]|uniref:Hemolytic protein HlpA-like protein n=1 Tax=Hyella patelloides LEGE 07179 TaxID=945734 RepID=A0A563VSB3_9CYAN|nr:glycosyltransferase family 2 protein [Hyella patelloides]VEP14286.1 conserved hypothetical protein [Hyella patelloides LEGE 07179]
MGLKRLFSQKFSNYNFIIGIPSKFELIISMKTPIAFIIFKRPDTTEKVFEAIRQAKPSKLFVIADGPRKDKPGEAEKCAASRAIIDRVDWNCEVKKNYSDTNLGCKKRVSSGLDWVFSMVEEAIILEDDCLPHPTFFRFCAELLEKYREDYRIASICGTNVQKQWQSQIASYHFSIYGSVWGWATWKRAWKYYDLNTSEWSKSEFKNAIKYAICSEKQYEARKKRFDKAFSDQVNSWAAKWLFACLLNSGLSVVPAVNLISNIGFTEEATHTTKSNNEVENITLSEMVFPLKENNLVVPDRTYDNWVYEKLYKPPSLGKRISSKIISIFQK